MPDRRTAGRDAAALSAYPASLPDKIGGFELVSKLGQGAMGVVYKARQESLDRIVALKVLSHEVAQKDPLFVERFFREARTSARLNHPNIVQGIEVGRDEATGVFFFAMELIDGPSVQNLLEINDVIDERQALSIIEGVARALVCSHRAGIVHRDIKPDNILLTSAGEPKLADLGLAKRAVGISPDQTGVIDPKGLSSRADAGTTQFGMAVGTPFYMAPEQAQGLTDQIDIRSDLYSVGATLYHMLTGKPPYNAQTTMQIMHQHCAAPVPNARSVNKNISEATSSLVAKLMQKDPRDRFQTPDQLVAELERIQKVPAAPERRTPKTTRVKIAPKKPPTARRVAKPQAEPLAPEVAARMLAEQIRAEVPIAPAEELKTADAELLPAEVPVEPEPEPAVGRPWTVTILSLLKTAAVIAVVVGACALTTGMLMGHGTLENRWNNCMTWVENTPVVQKLHGLISGPVADAPEDSTLHEPTPAPTITPDRAEIINPEE